MTVVVDGTLGVTTPGATLTGPIAGGGNQINNVIIGASTPLAGSFTSLNATTAITSAGTVLTAGYTVATLPTGARGMMTYVTDALTPGFLTAVVGGGAVVAPVFYNGSSWVSG